MASIEQHREIEYAETAPPVDQIKRVRLCAGRRIFRYAGNTESALPLGEIIDGQPRLSDSGRMVQQVWDDLPNHYPGIECDVFVIMPNHTHGIIVVVVDTIVGAGFKPAPTRHGLPEIIRGFKTFSARRINDLRKSPGIPILATQLLRTHHPRGGRIESHS